MTINKTTKLNDSDCVELLVYKDKGGHTYNVQLVHTGEECQVYQSVYIERTNCNAVISRYKIAEFTDLKEAYGYMRDTLVMYCLSNVYHVTEFISS